jgi:hypothetical protein
VKRQRPRAAALGTLALAGVELLRQRPVVRPASPAPSRSSVPGSGTSGGGSGSSVGRGPGPGRGVLVGAPGAAVLVSGGSVTTTGTVLVAEGRGVLVGQLTHGVAVGWAWPDSKTDSPPFSVPTHI